VHLFLVPFSSSPGRVVSRQRAGRPAASPDKKALSSKKEKGPLDLHPILPKLWFKGKRKEKLTR
jgi:hypothetical protein